MVDPFNCEKLEEVAQLLQLSKNLTVKALASHLYMERTTLYRKIKNCTGLSPNKWVIHFKLETACKRLITTQERISAIAENSGYDNVTSFNKAFQLKYKINPTTYRRRHEKSIKS